MYNYLTNDRCVDKEAKRSVCSNGNKIPWLQRVFEDNKTTLGLQQAFRSEILNVSTETVNKFEDNKRIQTSDQITSYSEKWIW